MNIENELKHKACNIDLFAKKAVEDVAALVECPFCGSEAEFNSDEFGEGVCCKSCGATMHNGVYGEEGRKLASADWNARPIENELNEKIEKLEEENARLREALGVILDEAQKDEPCILAIKVVAYTTLKGENK